MKRSTFQIILAPFLGITALVAAACSGGHSPASSSASQDDTRGTHDPSGEQSRPADEAAKHREKMHRMHGEACSGPSFTVCSNAQIAAIVAAISRGGIDVMPESTGSLPEVDALAQRLHDESTALESDAAALAVEQGITPEANDLSIAILRRDDIYSSEPHAGQRGLLSYVTHQALTHFQNLNLLDRVLLGSTQNLDWLALLRRARDMTAAQLRLTLETQASVVGACGSGTPSATREPPSHQDRACASPAFALCSDAQVAAIALTLESDRNATWAAQNGIDGAVRDLGQSRADNAARLTDALHAAAAGAGITPAPNDLATGINFTTVFQFAALAVSGESSSALDREFVRFEVLAHFEALNVIERLLLPSARGSALRDVLLDMRATAVDELQAAFSLHATLEGKCGEAPPADAGTPAPLDADCVPPDDGTK
jgi:hypothetical protein